MKNINIHYTFMPEVGLQGFSYHWETPQGKNGINMVYCKTEQDFKAVLNFFNDNLHGWVFSPCENTTE